MAENMPIPDGSQEPGHPDSLTQTEFNEKYGDALATATTAGQLGDSLIVDEEQAKLDRLRTEYPTHFRCLSEAILFDTDS